LQEEAQPFGYFDVVAWLVLCAALVVVCATFRDYGIPWDAQGEAEYGELLIRFYTSGFADHSAFNFVNFRFYGGGFELPAALLARISPFAVHETRHLFCALLGLFGLAATWRLARRLGGARAGALAAGMLLLNPSWYGHGFINARDIPFGAGVVTSLLLTLRALEELPRIRWRTRIALGVVIGFTVSVRVGGVLALLFLAVPIALWLLGRARSGAARSDVARELARIAAALASIAGVAYCVMIVFWPWAALSPLNPLRALLMFSRFPFEANVLFGGALVPARDLPAAYLPVQFLVRSPESLLAGLALAAAFGCIALRRGLSQLLELQRLKLVAVGFAALFPFVYFVLLRPVAYNGMRHFLFVIPPLSVLAALAFDRSLRVKSPAVRSALAVGLALAALAQTRALIALHPDQYTYFNRLAGGPRGAHGRFELDYWGTSLEEATDLLVGELEDDIPRPAAHRPYKVYVCGNVWSASTFFPNWLVPVERIEQADFQIAIDNFFCKHAKGSRRVAEVAREGAVLSYVEDLRPARLAPGERFEQSRAKVETGGASRVHVR
jgi:Dolichyl-phosphate-mannose-protein mannosyltransferase